MKLFIITSDSDSNWLSCKTISKNLRLSYELLKDKFELSYFNFAPQMTEEKSFAYQEGLSSLAEKIKKEKPDRLVFVDHFPLPPQFLNHLKNFLRPAQFPQILIHVYGDFTYFSQEWVKFLSSAEDFKIHFITASDAQKKLMEYFLPKHVTVDKCFFPLDGKDYFFDANLRASAREKYGVEADETVLIYTGRISLQKNVEYLLNEYVAFAKKHPNKKTRLWLVGGFDDSGAEIFGVKTYEGYLFSKFQNILDKAPDNIRSKITMFGQKNKKEVLELLNASDVFCSLSLFHDDDFGMAPAEALATGLPAFLTAWGGYSSFCSEEWDCTLLGVSITHLGHLIDMSSFRRRLESSEVHSNRVQNSRNFMNAFSIQKASTLIADLVMKDVSRLGEMSFKLYHYSNLSKHRNASGLSEYFLPSDDGLYHSMYSNYISLSAEKET